MADQTMFISYLKISNSKTFIYNKYFFNKKVRLKSQIDDSCIK